MKNSFFPCGIIIGVFFCWFPSYSVARTQLPPACVDSKTDQNGFLNELSTEDFNKSAIGALVDGVFVKSLIGVNMDSLRTFNIVSGGPLTIKGIKTENDSIVVTQKDFHKNPVRINGMDYTRFACTSFGKKVELLSLDDIRKTYFPQMDNLSDYLTRVRLDKAKRLLDDNQAQYSLSSIAGMVGYKDEYYFNKCFKKLYGISPKKYVEHK